MCLTLKILRRFLKTNLLKEMEYPTFTQSRLFFHEKTYLVKCQARRQDF